MRDLRSGISAGASAHWISALWLLCVGAHRSKLAASKWPASTFSTTPERDTAQVSISVDGVWSMPQPPRRSARASGTSGRNGSSRSKAKRQTPPLAGPVLDGDSVSGKDDIEGLRVSGGAEGVAPLAAFFLQDGDRELGVGTRE
jgi:hypothetical protein